MLNQLFVNQLDYIQIARNANQAKIAGFVKILYDVVDYNTNFAFDSVNSAILIPDAGFYGITITVGLLAVTVNVIGYQLLINGVNEYWSFNAGAAMLSYINAFNVYLPSGSSLTVNGYSDNANTYSNVNKPRNLLTVVRYA